MSITSPRLLFNDTVLGNLAAAAESAVCQLNGVSTQGPGASVHLTGRVELQGTTGATNLVIRVRRGAGVGGAEVSSQSVVFCGVGDNTEAVIIVVDVPGDVADLPYTLTAQVQGASGATTVDRACLTALY